MLGQKLRLQDKDHTAPAAGFLHSKLCELVVWGHCAVDGKGLVAAHVLPCHVII